MAKPKGKQGSEAQRKEVNIMWIIGILIVFIITNIPVELFRKFVLKKGWYPEDEEK